ncbi:MAG: hypothetical protein ACJ74U_12400 [Jatrophihabitantaceae bacterium]
MPGPAGRPVLGRPGRIRILEHMRRTDPPRGQRTELSLVPARQRRQLALLMLPVAAVLLAAGMLLAWRAGSVAGHLVGALVALIALVLLGVGQGLLSSARRDDHEQRLDEAIRAATGPCGNDCGSGCASNDCAVRALPRN